MTLYIKDHLGGFDINGNNKILHCLNLEKKTVQIEYILSPEVKSIYNNLEIKFLFNIHKFNKNWFGHIAPQKKIFKNFVCSFNGSDTISRQFLTAALYKFKWISNGYFSKNFSCFRNRIDGNISKFFDNKNEERFYRKFILDESIEAEDFYKSIVSIDYRQFDHKNNINLLQPSISNSFVQIIGETEGASYVPFITEKFIYPIVCGSLWIGYAQPKWHEQIEKYFGFKLYTKLFDYRFDTIQNPVERLVELMTMISKFSMLSTDDWRDLYLLQRDEIEYNYNHYFSGDYLKSLEKFV